MTTKKRGTWGGARKGSGPKTEAHRTIKVMVRLSLPEEAALKGAAGDVKLSTAIREFALKGAGIKT